MEAEAYVSQGYKVTTEEWANTGFSYSKQEEKWICKHKSDWKTTAAIGPMIRTQRTRADNCWVDKSMEGRWAVQGLWGEWAAARMEFSFTWITQRQRYWFSFKGSILCGPACPSSARSWAGGGWKGKLKRSEWTAWFGQTALSLDLLHTPCSALFFFLDLTHILVLHLYRSSETHSLHRCSRCISNTVTYIRWINDSIKLYSSALLPPCLG